MSVDHSGIPLNTVKTNTFKKRQKESRYSLPAIRRLMNNTSSSLEPPTGDTIYEETGSPTYEPDRNRKPYNNAENLADEIHRNGYTFLDVEIPANDFQS